MTTLLDRFSDHTRRVFARHRGRSFVDGAMAAAALVALADGDASIEEGAEVGRLMRVLDILRAHDPERGVDSYLHYVDILRREPDKIGKVRRVVTNAAGHDAEAAALLVVICHAMSEADGIVRESEIDEIHTLARMLDVDPDVAAEKIAPVSVTG